MNTRIYNPIGSGRLWLIALIALVGMASCSSIKHSTATAPPVSQPRLASLGDSQVPTGAAAQATSSTATPAQSDSEDELLASNAAVPAAVSSQNKLKEKLVQLNSRMAEAKNNQAVRTEVKSKKLSFPAKLMVNKLLKKTSRLAHKSTAQIGAQEATQASNSTLLIVGLLIVIIGLLLTLLATGSAQTIGIIALIVGIVLSIVALVG